jgi:peptide deformylase
VPPRDQNGARDAPDREGSASTRAALAAAAAPDPEVEARRSAALARIRAFGDPALRTKAGEVVTFDQALQDEALRMARVMEDAQGVGLAATQLGVMHRMLVYRPAPDAPLLAVVNPRLEWASRDEEVAEEGCLSLPAVVVDVERPVHVRVSAVDTVGGDMLLEASGLEARILQHEMDHLDGILILDRISREQRKEALRILREGPPDEPAAAEPVEAASA